MPRLSGCARDGAGRKLKDRVWREASRNPARKHLLAHFLDLLLAVQVEDVNGKFHAETVNSLAGNNPQAVARLEAGMFQQAGAPLGAAVGNFGGVSQYGVPGDVANVDFQAFRYSTDFEIARAGLLSPRSAAIPLVDPLKLRCDHAIDP